MKNFSANKIIVILGPNASGKSEFAVKIAKKFNGEIISADSRQVYKGLNIGSGKVEGRWIKKFRPAGGRDKGEKIKKKYFVYKNIIHHCIDFVSPKRVFSAAEFKKQGEMAIAEIISRGKIPIICGGTGFYIDALLNNINLAQIPPDLKLRKKLEKKSCKELFLELKKLNPEKAEKIDKNNKRRLIRAVEIEFAIFYGPPRSVENLISELKPPKYKKVLYIGINHPPEILKQRIEKRLKDRLRLGMVKEARNLHFKHKLRWKRLNDLGLEYRYISYFLLGKMSEKELFEKIETGNWHYAKRQLTWFKKNKKINWIDLSSHDLKKSEKLIENFLTEK